MILLLYNLAVSLAFRNVEYHDVKIRYELIFQFLIFVILSISDKKYFRWSPFFLLFSFLVPPISIFYLINQELITVALIPIFLILSKYKKQTFRILRKKFFLKLILSTLVFLVVFITLQTIINTSYSNSFLAFFVILVYLTSLFCFYLIFSDYRIRKEELANYFFYKSGYFALLGFFIALNLYLYHNRIRVMVNENHVSMFFDWVIIFSFLPLIVIKKDWKKLLYGIYLFYFFVFAFFTLWLFRNETSIYGFLLILIFFIIVSLIEKLPLNTNKKNLILIVFFLITFVLIYIYIWKLAKNGNGSLINRFFYWQVALAYLFHHPFGLLFGTSEFQSFFLFKYLTFEINKFPYHHMIDIFSSFHNHLHNDLVSFWFAGGLLFLSIYLLTIYKTIFSFFDAIQNHPIFIVFGGIVLISILHGITEPFAFSISTGFVFWFFSFVILISKNSHNQTNSRNESLNSDLVKKIYKYFSILILIAISYFSLVLFVQIKIFKKYNSIYIHQFYFYAHHRHIQNPNPNETNELIRLARLKNFLFPFDSVNHRILGDLYIIKYSITNEEKLLNLARQSYCSAFSLRNTEAHYLRLKWFSAFFQKNFDEICEEKSKILKKFDPYKIIPEYVYHPVMLQY
ncbi:MAG: O-antigen ligase family protein [Leptospiraceae bacterium]|nr:O-antigen ligase family protein [Leptospiraceae bacterium]